MEQSNSQSVQCDPPIAEICQRIVAVSANAYIKILKVFHRDVARLQYAPE